MKFLGKPNFIFLDAKEWEQGTTVETVNMKVEIFYRFSEGNDVFYGTNYKKLLKRIQLLLNIKSRTSC